MNPPPTLNDIGRYTAMAGGVLLLISLFVPWFGSGPFSESAFEWFRRDDLYLLLIALAVAGLAVADIFLPAKGLVVVAGALGLLAFGGPFFVLLERSFDDTAIGWFLELFAAGLVVTGGALSLFGMAHVNSRLTPSSDEANSIGRTPTPPAGWYADPAEQSRLRYWSGDAWTEKTQG